MARRIYDDDELDDILAEDGAPQELNFSTDVEGDNCDECGYPLVAGVCEKCNKKHVKRERIWKKAPLGKQGRDYVPPFTQVTKEI